MIPHSRPFTGSKEWQAAKRVIASGHLAQGREVARLEKELCSFVGHRYGLAVSSGTAALYAALKALDIGTGDNVIIPTYACTALANAVCMAGAQPVLCDVDGETALMSVASVRASLMKNTRAVIVPHLFGYPAPVHDIEQETGLPVIEDCAQCIGAEINGKTVGSLSSIAIFSFYATKVLCAGEGGMTATSDSRLARRLEDLREYDNRDRWEPRFNLKCSDVHAAIARVQLARLPGFIRRRRTLAKRYQKAIIDNKYIAAFPTVTERVKPMFYRFIIRTAGRNRSAVIRYFTGQKIACARPIYKPFHRYLKRDGFPVSRRLYGELLSIPLYPALSDQQGRTMENTLRTLTLQN